jgi:hypothetical protein
LGVLVALFVENRKETRFAAMRARLTPFLVSAPPLAHAPPDGRRLLFPGALLRVAPMPPVLASSSAASRIFLAAAVPARAKRTTHVRDRPPRKNARQ